MGRGKLRLELIKSDKARKLAFEKRRRGLEKAANELSTLCGVDIAMIINNVGSMGPTTIWPRGQETRLERLIDAYNKSRSSGNECRYGTYNLSAYFKDQTQRIEDEIQKLRKMNKEAKYPKWDDGFNTLSQDDLKEFVSGLTAKIASARERINLIKESTRSTSASRLMLVESSKPQVHETQSIWKFEQPAPLQYYYDDHWSSNKMGKNQMMMMMNDNGASCSQGPYYIFDQNPQAGELARSTSLENYWSNMGIQRMMTMNNAAASCIRGGPYYNFDHNQDQRMTMMMINDAPSCSWGPNNFDLDPSHLYLR